MQEIRRLLHRIRAVRDDDAIDILTREQRIATRGEAQPDHFPHVLAVNGGNLLAFHLCIAADLRHSRQEICNADGTGLIPCRRLFRRCSAGNRPARREDVDVFLDHGLLSFLSDAFFILS